jgi:hypothetical protein
MGILLGAASPGSPVAAAAAIASTAASLVLHPPLDSRMRRRCFRSYCTEELVQELLLLLEVNEALRLGFWEGLSLASSAAPPLSTKQISHLRHHPAFQPTT